MGSESHFCRLAAGVDPVEVEVLVVEVAEEVVQIMMEELVVAAQIVMVELAVVVEVGLSPFYLPRL